VGGDVGAGDLKNSQSFTQTPNAALNPFGIVFDPVTFNSTGNWGATGGIHGGYNWQLAPSWLVGVEADWDKANVGNTPSQVNLTNGGLPIPACFGLAPGATACHGLMMSQNLEWTASARARLGYVWGSMLFFGTGGVAWASEERSGQVTGLSFNSSSIAVSGNHSDTGWVAGGGVELMATRNWLVRLEYLHYQFNGGTTVTAACGSCAAGAFAGSGNFTWNSSTFDVLRAGLSYKF
jgi:outer membrane immunogenic protein